MKKVFALPTALVAVLMARMAIIASESMEPPVCPTFRPRLDRKLSIFCDTFKKAMVHRNHSSTLPETASLPEALTADSTSLSEMANALVDITKTRASISRQFKKNRFLMDTPYRDKGFAINVPTMLVNSRRHHAFMSSRNTCPPSIRHQDFQMFDVCQ